MLDGSASLTVGDAEPFTRDAVIVPQGDLHALEGDVPYLFLDAPVYIEGGDIYEEA